MLIKVFTGVMGILLVLATIFAWWLENSGEEINPEEEKGKKSK
ncbi:unknown [Clostridium sp. CAG:411]|jgi:hypothetical protein|nr:hypothetical protein [Lachnospiraceae bacterium]CDE45816.1 unknown [Clostridium sp. CAG:411]